MKLGINFKTGHKRSLTSWISDQVPATGSFTLGGDPNGSSQLVVWWQRNVRWTSGLSNESYFNDRLDYDEYSYFDYVSNEKEKYLTYSEQGNFSLGKVRLDSSSTIQNFGRYTDVPTIGFSYCSLNWRSEDPGCVEETWPACRKSDVRFHGRRGSVYVYSTTYDQSRNLSLFDCEVECRQNCSCVAFASINNNGTGCELLNKITEFYPSVSRDSRYWASELLTERMIYFVDTRRSATQWWIGLIDAAGGTLLLLSILCCIVRIKLKGKEKQAQKMLLHELADEDLTAEIDRKGKKMNQVHLFSFRSLEMATSNFSMESKLGEGGFGSVYKGKLPSGQEIAIKRLSRSSGQGLLEFKNEILLIAKLQHDNLVKLLGCCIEGQEMILIYEYMPNRSLDYILFDPRRRESINWMNRINIVEGVAQGLLYLHKYSRLRVIHRDLKASNILLDQSMNPKISDFGMARIFGKQDTEANTKRIVGTHGYMSPDYAMKCVFSVKSDVFSFGVLLLEIISGKKNHGCYHSERPLNLIGLAWELWIEERAIELADQTLDITNQKHEIMRCTHIGLLCVQDNAIDRPSMTDVTIMLTNESLQLLEPKRPAFFIETSTREAVEELDLEKPCSNDLSISVMDGR